MSGSASRGDARDQAGRPGQRLRGVSKSLQKDAKGSEQRSKTEKGAAFDKDCIDTEGHLKHAQNVQTQLNK